jgi:serralysin
MNGDTVFNFGLSTTIDIERAAVGRNHLSVTQFDGDTTLAVGNTQILLEGIFNGGEFMTVVRGQGDDAHTMVTFETFLPEQGEGVRTDARAINGIANEPFMTGDGTVRFSTTLENASSSFANSLGVYKVATDGRIFDVRIVFADTLNVAARTVDLGTPADGVKLGFFLIQNGVGAYGNLPDNLSFVTAGTSNPANLNDGVPLTLMSATRGALATTAVFHSFQTLNPADAIQVLSGVAPGGKDLLVAFEDLPTETGDNDFQDVVVRIHTNQDDLFVV